MRTYVRLGLLMAVAAAMLVWMGGGREAAAQGLVTFDIDPEITGNTGGTLGTVQDCVRVNVAGGFDAAPDYTIDAVVTGGTQAPTGYDASVTYDNTKVKILDAGTNPLIKLPGAWDSTMDEDAGSYKSTDGTLNAGAGYLFGGPGTAGNGAIVRLGLDINGAAGSFILTFGFVSPTDYVSGAGSHPVSTATGMLAVNRDCPGPEVDLAVDSLVMTERNDVFHVQSRGTHTGGPAPDTVAARVSHTVTAPSGCTVNGAPSASDSWTGTLAAGQSYTLVTDFHLQCSASGTYLFVVENTVDLLEPGYLDPNPANDSDTVNPGAEVLAIADRDGDTLPDALDNCAGDVNPGQEDNDRDYRGDLCDPDDDDDGYSDAREAYLGTDPLNPCAAGIDAWPPDTNMDTFVTVGGDLLPYRGRIGATGGPPPSANWLRRLDLNADNFITVGGDVLDFRGLIGTICRALCTAKFKCGVESFTVEWKQNPDAGAANPSLRLDVAIVFKSGGEFNPACCEYKQNVMSLWQVTAGPHKDQHSPTSPMRDDDYSRTNADGVAGKSDDTDGKPELTDPGFTTNDNPGWWKTDGFAADDNLDYAFTAEQIVYAPGSAKCEANPEVAKRGPHTGTITGKDPRTYGGVPITLGP